MEKLQDKCKSNPYTLYPHSSVAYILPHLLSPLPPTMYVYLYTLMCIHTYMLVHFFLEPFELLRDLLL